MGMRDVGDSWEPLVLSGMSSLCQTERAGKEFSTLSLLKDWADGTARLLPARNSFIPTSRQASKFINQQATALRAA